jgi:hypothetical protein
MNCSGLGLSRNRVLENPPLPGPLLPVFPDGNQEARGKEFFAFVPKVARSSQPWAECRNPFGVKAGTRNKWRDPGRGLESA